MCFLCMHFYYVLPGAACVCVRVWFLLLQQQQQQEAAAARLRWATMQRKDSNGQSVSGWGTPAALGASVGSSEDFPDLLEGAANTYGSGAATPPVLTPAGAGAAPAAAAAGAAAAAPAAGAATAAVSAAAAARTPSSATGAEAAAPAAARKGGAGTKGKVKGNTQSLQDFIAAAAVNSKKESAALPLGATAWSQGAPKGLAASVPPPTPIQQQKLQQQQLQQQQQQQRNALATPVKKNAAAAARSSGASSAAGGFEVYFELHNNTA